LLQLPLCLAELFVLGAKLILVDAEIFSQAQSIDVMLQAGLQRPHSGEQFFSTGMLKRHDWFPWPLPSP
jgi:hypothetical protein